MAIRTITWTVDEDMQVTPSRVQNAGVQGDNNATRVVFSLPAFLQEGYTLYIECVDGVGEGDKTDPLAVIDGAVSFDLPLKWTQHGGEAVLRLVAEVDGVIAYTAAGRVRYDGRAKAFAKMKSLVEGSIQAAQDRIAKMIADAKVWIDNVNGVYVGSGEMPDSAVIQIDPEGEVLLLDNEMSDESENVPKTKVVKAYVDAGLSGKLDATAFSRRTGLLIFSAEPADTGYIMATIPVSSNVDRGMLLIGVALNTGFYSTTAGSYALYVVHYDRVVHNDAGKPYCNAKRLAGEKELLVSMNEQGNTITVSCAAQWSLGWWFGNTY